MCASSSALGTVLNSSWDDEDVAFAKFDVTVAKLDRHAALQHQEEVIGVWVRMPDELALDFPDLELVLVVVADDPRRERLVEGCELLGEIDRRLHGYSAVSIWAFWRRPE
jgi:hypothetical protein